MLQHSTEKGKTDVSRKTTKGTDRTSNTMCFSREMNYSPTLSARMASVLSRPLADLSLAALESLSA